MPVGESKRERNERLFGTPTPVAFLTGSVARVGRCVAEFFLHESFRVIFHAHKNPDQARAGLADLKVKPDEWHLLSGPVQDESTVEAWRDEAVSRFGRVDVLVNSAAIWDPKPLETTMAADFMRHFEINTLGSALTCKHFGLLMTQQASGGAIINIGDWAICRPYRDFAGYFPSKGAIDTLTQSMAVELAIRNPRVRVNAVLPGPVLLADNVSQAQREKIRGESLLQREGTADDVAAAIVFLATSPFVTGVCLPVDGGRSIYAGPAADSIAHPTANP
jgi:pteridine reductase